MKVSCRFGPYRLDALGFRLLLDDREVALSPKGLDLLFLLASRPEALVSKDEIQHALWPDVAVSDNALTQVVSDLRQALGDNAASPRYIQTVARRGYRFIAKVKIDPPDGEAAPPRVGARETSSAEAHRAATEGRLKLEMLDPAQVPAAIVDFNHAISLDPRYTLAYVGRANARFWRYEASRAQNRPDAMELTTAIADIRRAIELDPELAEPHAALAFFLTSAGQSEEAAAAGRRAVALDAGNWRHLFRLGVATWGDERLTCLEQVVQHYPEFQYAYFVMAMVYVARGELAAAERILRQGLSFEESEKTGVSRFPGRGLHWLMGLIRLAVGDPDEAHSEFDRELSSRGGEIYAAEYVMDAYNGHGFAFLQQADPKQAAVMFGRALEFFPDHARSLTGLAEAYRRDNRGPEASDELEHAARAIDELRASGRTTEAEMAVALAHAAAGRASEAVIALDQFLAGVAPGFAGWTIPIEPLFTPIRNTHGFQAVLARLAARAR